MLDSLGCPKCNKLVWVSLGGRYDPESFECVYCDHVFPVPGWEPAMGEVDLDYPNPTYKTPNDAAGY